MQLHAVVYYGGVTMLKELEYSCWACWHSAPPRWVLGLRCGGARRVCSASCPPETGPWWGMWGLPWFLTPVFRPLRRARAGDEPLIIIAGTAGRS